MKDKKMNTETMNNLEAMFAQSSDIMHSKKANSAKIELLAENGETAFYRLTLPNSTAKMNVAGRIRVAMRAVEGLEAKDATRRIDAAIEQTEEATETAKVYLVKVVNK